MNTPLRILCVAAALSLVACRPSIHTRQTLLDEVVDNQPARWETFEATLRVLDEHPEYVDELFQQMLQHRPALNRFLAINASGLDDPQYAALMARHLVRHPRPLTEVMIQVLEAAKDKPEAQQAMALAMDRQAGLTAQTTASRTGTVVSSTRALLDVFSTDARARQAYLEVLQERKEQVAAILLSDPEALAAVMGAMAERGVKDSAVADQLRGLVEGLTGKGGSGQEGKAPQSAPQQQPSPQGK
jgi:hypothetical protein